jgi:hypothetical protein
MQSGSVMVLSFWLGKKENIYGILNSPGTYLNIAKAE